MKFLDLRQIVGIVVLSSAVYACGGERSFIDDIGVGGSSGASGTGGQSGSGGSGGSGGSAGGDASSTGGRDSGGGTAGSSGSAGGDGSSTTDARDASDAADAADAAEEGPPPPPPPPGRPGFDFASGGAWSKSTNFKAFVSTSEMPGYNGLYTSPNFRLRSGVIATTQP